MTNEPEFKQFCRENYFIVDGFEDDNNSLDNDNVHGHFSDDELPQDETDEVNQCVVIESSHG